VLTAHKPAADLVDPCRRHDLLLLITVSAAPEAGNYGQATDTCAGVAGDRIDVRLGPDGKAGGLRALTSNRELTIVVRPDRVIAGRGHPVPAAALALEHPGRRQSPAVTCKSSVVTAPPPVGRPAIAESG
jgi:hypothetical protein